MNGGDLGDTALLLILVMGGISGVLAILGIVADLFDRWFGHRNRRQ